MKENRREAEGKAQQDNIIVSKYNTYQCLSTCVEEQFRGKRPLC